MDEPVRAHPRKRPVWERYLRLKPFDRLTNIVKLMHHSDKKAHDVTPPLRNTTRIKLNAPRTHDTICWHRTAIKTAPLQQINKIAAEWLLRQHYALMSN